MLSSNSAQKVQVIDVGQIHEQHSHSRDKDKKIQGETLCHDEEINAVPKKVAKSNEFLLEQDQEGMQPAEIIGQGGHHLLEVTDSSCVKLDEVPDSQRELLIEQGPDSPKDKVVNKEITPENTPFKEQLTIKH